MKTKLPCLAIIAGALAFTPMARSEGQVRVNFETPEHFSDAITRLGGQTDPQILNSLREYLVTTASPRLAAGTTLTITFTNLDRAGEYVAPRATRRLTSQYPPKAKFTWVLTDANGAIVRQGTESLVDMWYLTQSNLANDPLFYDKEMLKTWVKRTFKG